MHFDRSFRSIFLIHRDRNLVHDPIHVLRVVVQSLDLFADETTGRAQAAADGEIGKRIRELIGRAHLTNLRQLLEHRHCCRLD